MLGAGKDLMVNSGAGNGSDVSWDGGKSVMLAEATFGGGTVKLQVKLPNASYADVTNGSLSAAGITIGLELPAGVYRAVATTATAVYARLARVPY